jgi:hypothetical protein
MKGLTCDSNRAIPLCSAFHLEVLNEITQVQKLRIHHVVYLHSSKKEY